jgi:predicted phosphoribosyltransferase
VAILKSNKIESMFKDRAAAGLVLADQLKQYKNTPGVVLAVPRGGVPIAYVVAKELGLPLEVILTKKIGHPFNKEYAIGAATLTDYFIVPHDDVSPEYIERELRKVRSRLQEMHTKFMGNHKPVSLEGKTVIVIDDGIATGNTLMATVQLLRQSNPGKIVIAVPVASESAVAKLTKVVDEVIVEMVPEEFYGVGSFYEDFRQVTDEDVMNYLRQIQAAEKV